MYGPWAYAQTVINLQNKHALADFNMAERMERRQRQKVHLNANEMNCIMPCRFRLFDVGARIWWRALRAAEAP
jgi:hypothetical protein